MTALWHDVVDVLFTLLSLVDIMLAETSAATT
jgi:hypothetical protein